MQNQHKYAYIIKGGQPVVGEIKCLGAKNFTTKAMVAALLGDTSSVFTNVPPIGDVTITKEMLTSIGVKVEFTTSGTLVIDPSSMSSSDVPTPDSRSNRIPILLLGALLHRFEKVAVPLAGGDQTGARHVDLHLEAIRQLCGQVDGSPDRSVAPRTLPLKGP